MLCAGKPQAPAAPTLLIGNLDQITINWALPPDNGGAPVLGYFLYMKAAADPNYTKILLQKGLAAEGEDPTVLSFTTRVDHLGSPLRPNTFSFVLSARNWVDVSLNSTALTFVIPYLSDPALSSLSLLNTIEAAVTASVHMVAHDQNGIQTTEFAGDAYFLRVENACTVTSNYRCDLTSPG